MYSSFFIIGQFIIINQDIRETDNRIERSPDFVTHIGKERLFQLSFQRQILGSGQFFPPYSYIPGCSLTTR